MPEAEPDPSWAHFVSPKSPGQPLGLAPGRRGREGRHFAEVTGTRQEEGAEHHLRGGTGAPDTRAGHIGAALADGSARQNPGLCAREGPSVCRSLFSVVRYVQGGERDFIPLTDAGTGWETTGGWEYPAVPERSEERLPSAPERRGAGGFGGSGGCRVKGSLCSDPRSGCQGFSVGSLGSCLHETTSVARSQRKRLLFMVTAECKLNSRLHLAEDPMDNNASAKAS